MDRFPVGKQDNSHKPSPLLALLPFADSSVRLNLCVFWAVNSLLDPYRLSLSSTVRPLSHVEEVSSEFHWIILPPVLFPCHPRAGARSVVMAQGKSMAADMEYSNAVGNKKRGTRDKVVWSRGVWLSQPHRCCTGHRGGMLHPLRVSELGAFDHLTVPDEESAWCSIWFGPAGE